MTIQFHSPCVFVSDMERARSFYEEALGLTPNLILDGYVVYEGFCLWRTDTARKHVFDEPEASAEGPMGRDNFELYFEAERLEDAWDRVMPRAETIHPMKIQPWGQRCFRVRDPEGHILEVAEPMETVIRRLHDQGQGLEAIAAATMMDPDFVRSVLEA
jgi:catechol 2,3-dioxygenase-like lactoylglutathione lyase family enzyme